MMTTLRNSLILACLAYGCSSTPEANSPETPTPPEDTTTGSGADSQALSDKDPKSGNLVISDRIREACGIDDPRALFPYNSSRLSADAKALVQKLADCFTTGPLKGSQMRLVGHADPRGDEEYNMVLGGRRADQVKTLITKFGVPEEQVQTTSRGESDARGSDETSWAQDRRVEVTTS